MFLNYNEKTKQIPILMHGNIIASVNIDLYGHCSLVDLSNDPYFKSESLCDKSVMADVLQGIELANKGLKHTLFSDNDGEEPSETFYVTIPKDLAKDRPLLILDHETLWYATDLLLERELTEIYKITLESALL